MIDFRFPIERKTPPSAPVNSFDQMIVGCNLKNEYVPTYSIYMREEILNVDKGYMYFKPTGTMAGYSLSNYDALFDALSKGDRVSTYHFSTDGIDHQLLIFNHYLADMQGNILMMMAVKGYVLDKREYDPNNFKLFMSTELTTNPVYKNVYKQIEKKYLSEVQESQIDIEYTTSDKIQERFYNGLPEIKYSSISGLNSIKKKYHEYFNWISTLDEGLWYRGLDYQPPALIKPGYKVENLKVDDDAFQALLWQFISDGVSYPRFGIQVSFREFIDMAENANSPNSIKFTCDHTEEGPTSKYMYYPESHHIYDMQTERNFYLRLTSRNMVKKLSENLAETLWKVQNYVNFVQHKVSDISENDVPQIAGFRFDTTSTRFNIQIPEGMEITDSTPPWAIG